MNSLKFTNYQISVEVKKALLRQGLSVRACCEAFNRRFQDQILCGDMKKLDKDFIQRIRSNQFSVVTTRVVNLCQFLGIDIELEPCFVDSHFQEELATFENAIRTNPRLEPKIRNLLRNVAEIASLGGDFK